jgi:hypothetical protein
MNTNNFILFQLGFASVLILLAWLFFRPEEPQGRFKEYGKKAPPQPHQASDTLKGLKKDLPPPAQQRSRPAGPFLLEGFVGDGRPFEILGISPHADEKTIRSAHRELMKHYHPDRVGRPNSREWKDAQKIAETLNRARDEMLAQLKKRP